MQTVSNDQIIKEALDTLSQSNVMKAQQQARILIEGINLRLAQKADNTTRLTALQKELQSVSATEFTVESVLGAPLPVNSNAETISEVITQMNKERQDTVKLATVRLTNAITDLQSANLAIDAQVAELVTKLKAVQVEPVNAAAIVGEGQAAA